MPWSPNPKALAAALLISWCLLILFIWIAFKPAKSEVSGLSYLGNIFLNEDGSISQLAPVFCLALKLSPSLQAEVRTSMSTVTLSATSALPLICITGVGN